MSTCEHGEYEEGDSHERHCPEHPDYRVYVRDARLEVLNAIRALRYGGSVAVIPTVSGSEFCETEFLDSLTEWIKAYGQVVEAASETTTDMAKELADLRTQRKAVRDFLGIAPTLG